MDITNLSFNDVVVISIAAGIGLILLRIGMGLLLFVLGFTLQLIAELYTYLFIRKTSKKATDLEQEWLKELWGRK